MDQLDCASGRLLDAVRSRAVEILDDSIEAEKDTNPFLGSVPEILEALRSGQIECRVYDRDKFHAKGISLMPSLRSSAHKLWSVPAILARWLTKNIEAQRPNPKCPRGRIAPGMV
jgi:hypothetical protein